MAAKPISFLTVFPDLDRDAMGKILLYKDVGSIPFYLNAVCGWKSSLAYFNAGRTISDPYFESRVNLIPLGKEKHRFSRLYRTIKFIIKYAGSYDVVNFYHDSLESVLSAFIYKLINRSGKVYIKLDFDHLCVRREYNKLRNPFSLAPLWGKHLLSVASEISYSVETNSYYERLQRHFHYKKTIFLLPNGFSAPGPINIDEIISKKKNIILVVGRIGAYQKNHQLLIDAITRIKPEIMNNWKVVLVGPIVDPEFQGYIRNNSDAHPHLKSIFLFTGSIEDKLKLFQHYKEAKIFCLTSRFEGFPLVALEAMYFGNYLISTDLPVAEELVSNNAGKTFTNSNASLLADCLKEAMTNDALVKSIGKQAHYKINSEYNWKHLVDKLSRILIK